MTSRGLPTRLQQRARKSSKEFRKACAQLEKVLEPLNRGIIALLVHGRPLPETIETADLLAQQLRSLMDAVDQVRGHVRPAHASRCADKLLENLKAPEPSGAPAVGAARRPPQALLRGSNRCVPVATVLELLSTQGKSGTLRVSTEHESFTLEMVGGDIVHSTTDRPPQDQLLGNILVEQGAVTREALDAFLARMRDSTERIGDALEREELTTKEQLRAALAAQVQQRFNRLFQAREATYYFFEQSQLSFDDRVRMNVTQLLLESARTSDEALGKGPSPGGRMPEPESPPPGGGWSSPL